MNLEKGLLAASIVFLLLISSVLVLRTALRGEAYDIEQMVVNRDVLYEGREAVQVYRLQGTYDPFQERSATRVIEVQIDLPELPPVPLKHPPVFWNKEGI